MSILTCAGIFYAGSRADEKAPGGYGPSENLPKKLEKKNVGQPDELSLVALPSEPMPFRKKYRGFRVMLVNRQKSEVVFDACDSRLSIVQEAQDDSGAWRPIEYLPSSDCGNSYHRVFLPSGHYWEFTAPAYKGSHKTKLRFVLLLDRKKKLHSNEFEGSVNESQLLEEFFLEPRDISPIE